MTEALSSETGKTYPSWEALIEAEANGYVAVAIISDKKETWPSVLGPFPTQREANNARNRLRAKFKREASHYPGTTTKFYVRPAWKDLR